MKKIFLAAAVVAAAGAYWVAQDKEEQGFSPVLDYVPADTVLFSGQFKPISIKDYIDSLPKMAEQNSEELAELLFSYSYGDPSSLFFSEFLKRYSKAAMDGQTLIDTFGLPKRVRGYVYTIGMLPVIKIDIDKPEALWAFLDSLEADTGFTHEARSRGEVSYRAYPLENNIEGIENELVFAIHDNMLTITVQSSIADSKDFDVALGLVPADKPLSQSNMVQDIFAKHDFLEDGIAFLNHQELVIGGTTVDGNRFAKQLTSFLNITQQDFDKIRTETCHRELSSVVENWPKTVVGYRQLEIGNNKSNIEASVVFESKNQTIMSALKQIQGFIPSYAQDSNTLLAFAWGVNVDKFAPAMTKAWKEMLTPSFECAPLRELQTGISENNPAMLGMFAGFANGVKGLSFSMNDYQLASDKPTSALEKLDVLVSLAAEDPATIFNMAKSFVPVMATIEVPTDGTPVELNQLLPQTPYYDISANKVYMALKGNHLAIYTGEKSAKIADKLLSEKLVDNGMMTLSLDYKKLLAPIIKEAENEGQYIAQELELIKNFNMKVKVDLEVNDQGIVINSMVQSQQ